MSSPPPSSPSVDRRRRFAPRGGGVFSRAVNRIHPFPPERPEMKSKLKLDVDALEVTSFDTDAAAGGRGTVRAASEPLPASEAAPCAFETEITGPCCDYTLVLSCIETQCDECTWGPLP